MLSYFDMIRRQAALQTVWWKGWADDNVYVIDVSTVSEMCTGGHGRM